MNAMSRRLAYQHLSFIINNDIKLKYPFCIGTKYLLKESKTSLNEWAKNLTLYSKGWVYEVTILKTLEIFISEIFLIFTT